MNSVIAAYCGLYCASCPTYLDTQKRLSGKSKQGNYDVSCNGCKTDLNPPWCNECNLKACAKKKGIEFCSECHAYPCQDLVAFRDDPRYPYHIEVFDYLGIIKEQGEAKWLEAMEKRWGCSNCGLPTSWYDLECSQCGTALNGYKKPG